MDDLRTRAHLVTYDSGFTGSGAIGTVITRAEIADAATGGEFPATFLLDLDRAEEGSDVTAHATIAVEWDEETIAQLLASVSEPEIELWFDESTLAEAFNEVEAHGFREKAAVLAVAAVAAGASATPAFARVAADAQGGGGVAGTAAATATSSAQQGGPLGAQRALQEDEQLSSRQFHPATKVTTPTPAAPGAERGLQVDEMITPRIVHGFTASSAASTGGDTLSTSEIATIGGVGALLIAAAGFGVTRKRERPVLHS